MGNELKKIINDSPALREVFAEMSYSLAPKSERFPGGLRYRYFGKLEMFTGIWAFCYSTTRNENGKFISWVYQPQVGKKTWVLVKLLEHRLMKDAKARALRMYNQHKPIQGKYEELLKKRQRKGRK